MGPLTNVAMALRIQPEIAQKIEKIYIMGGGWHEMNITPAAEFNFWIDPEAAKIVVNSGVEIVMVPLDATHAGAISIHVAEQLEQCDAPAGQLAARLIAQRLHGYNNWQPMKDQTTVPIHDALAVCAAIDMAVLDDVRFVNVDVDCSGGLCDGQSVCDIEHKDKSAAPNVHLALGANRELFSEILLNTLTRKL